MRVTCRPMDLGAGILMFLFFLLVVGIFTLIAFATQGCGGWFLYAFLLPFWGVFPSASLGSTVGLADVRSLCDRSPACEDLLPEDSLGEEYHQEDRSHRRVGEWWERRMEFRREQFFGQ